MILRLMMPNYSPLSYQLSYCKIVWGATLDEGQTQHLDLLDPCSNWLRYKGLSNIAIITC
jgi:hypothetical protein